MLIIFFMAVLSLDLIPSSIQVPRNTTRRSLNSTNIENAKRNITIIKIVTTTRRPAPAIISTETILTNKTVTQSTKAKKPRRKLVIKRKKKRAKKKDHVSVSASNHRSKVKDLTPKSDMQVLQFYAQPLNTFDLNVQPLTPYNYNSLSDSNAFHPVNGQSMFLANPQSYANPMPTITLIPTVTPLAYKTLPHDDYHTDADYSSKQNNFRPVNYNWNVGKPIPVYDPFNVYKPQQNVKHKPIHLAPQKFLPAKKPMTPPSSMLPPISVTHVYRYKDEPDLKLPFINQEEAFDETLPILTAALNEHFNDRIASVDAKKYLQTKKINHPVYYNVPTLTLPATNHDLNNEFQLINKFNQELKTQDDELTTLQNAEDEENNETQEEKNYSDEDVKKALEYIQRLKKNKSDRGSKKYNDEGETQLRTSKRKGKKKNSSDADDEEDEEKYEKKKKRKKAKKEFMFEENDEEVQDAFSEEDKNQDESRKNEVIKTQRQDSLRSQESQIVPSVNDEHSRPDFSENASIGGDNDERVEFQMHGLRGPESYKFGYDTGKGENRQFRYEERDPDGTVRGHFGYYDKDGKLQMFNYEADPEHGYRLEKASEF